MAQYFQVLSQDDKNPEEVTQFYSNIDESPRVQYVIAAEGTQQQFHTQPVVVSSDQLMVVEGQGQQVIIDQSQVTYQSPQYVIQDSSTVDFQNTQQPVYYMANSPHNQPVVVDQPVVLNHQLMQTQVSKVITTPLHQTCINTGQVNATIVQDKSVNQLQQLRNQIKVQPARQSNIVSPRGVQINTQGAGAATATMSQNLRRELNERIIIDKEEREDLVSLSDGTVVSLQQYRRLLAQQKQNQTLQERLGSPAMSPTTAVPRKPKPAAARFRNPKLKQQTARVGNCTSEEEDFSEYSVNQKQNIPPQYQLGQRQPVTREPNPSPQQPQPSNNQYLILPPRSQTRTTNPRPLPSFLHSSQIQSIIESNPTTEEFSNSIRMLILLDNGEQRLITFTLPKEGCYIQEILEQVNVPFSNKTPIQVSEVNFSGLNYVVAVGNVAPFTLGQPNEEARLEHQYRQPTPPGEFDQSVDSTKSSPAATSPEPPKEIPPRIIEGKLAVCANCGYLSEDFNKCTRCKRKLPDNVKAISAISSNGKKVDPRSLVGEKRLGITKINGVPKMNLLQKKRTPKPKLLECETVVVSSDEEDSEKKSAVKNVSEQLLEKLGASVTLSPISKEPSIVDIQKNSLVAKNKSPEKILHEPSNAILITCRTVRIGSYRFVPPEPVHIDSSGFTLKVPHPKSDNTVKLIKIESRDIVKVLISFQKSLPVLFYYLLPSVGAVIRATLDMSQGSDYYFDPLSESEESHRRITLLPEMISEDCRLILQKIYNKYNVLDELTYKEANDILIKTCPKDLSKSVLSFGSMTEIKQLLLYPPEGRGRISINTEDYMCLGQDQFLNDVIIDFYLKYLVLNLPKEQQDMVHVFSTFFYKRLTTKPTKASRKSQPTELDPNLSPAQKRHARVKTWTKTVNIFDKDFIIVPINENCHWFLAIICFANMNGCHTMDGQPIRIEPKQSKKSKAQKSAGSNSAATSPVKDKKAEQQAIMCEEPELSDKDEAEGDDSELDSDDSEDVPGTLSVENNSKRPPIKQPCILIFDSLAGASRSRVVATLRDYLTCEYSAKMKAEKIYTKDVIKGACPKIPQQSNFTDCGLYLLQYVEQFFIDPIKDYYIPIANLKNWFEEITVTRKREEISALIKTLMKQYGKDLALLPDIIFPTLNGELTERARMEHDHFMDPDEGDEMMEEEDEEYIPPCAKNELKKVEESEDDVNDAAKEATDSPLKPSSENVKFKNDFIEQTVLNSSILKPDVSELPKQSNKDTLSYLKAKRIVRHKNINSDGPDSKKVKTHDTSANI